MKIQGHEISQDKQSAIIAAMKGEFSSRKLCMIAEAAGIPRYAPGRNGFNEYISSRVVDALLRRQKKAGKIAHIGGGKWWKK